MSATPKTDAIVAGSGRIQPTKYNAMMEHARTLERQNRELVAMLVECIDSLEYVDRIPERADGNLNTGYGVRAERIAKARALIEKCK